MQRADDTRAMARDDQERHRRVFRGILFSLEVVKPEDVVARTVASIRIDFSLLEETGKELTISVPVR